MFSIFKSKAPTFPNESKWQIIKEEEDGKPTFIRKNVTAPKMTPIFKFRMGFAVPLNAPNEFGLPVPDESVLLGNIEDRLLSTFERDQSAILVLVITTSGMREFVFYTNNTPEIVSKIEAALESVTTHKLQNYIAEDPKWEGYSLF